MVYARHLDVAIQLAVQLESVPFTPCLAEAAAVPLRLMVVDVPTWREIMLRARAPPRELEEYEPGSQRAGRQHEVASRVDRHLSDDVLFATLSDGPRQDSSWTSGWDGIVCCPDKSVDTH